MKYLIDAYNLIGKLTTISLSDPEKEDRLISRFKQLNKRPKDFFILVFDGKRKDFPYQSIQELDQIKVVFTDNSESADMYIIRMIKSHGDYQGYTVVSSDNEIKFHCKKNKVAWVASESFFRGLAKVHGSDDLTENYPTNTDIDFWLNHFNKS